MNAESLTQVLLHTRAVRRFHLNEVSLPVVLATIASYYEGKYERAALVWPWRRKVIHY